MNVRRAVLNQTLCILPVMFKLTSAGRSMLAHAHGNQLASSVTITESRQSAVAISFSAAGSVIPPNCTEPINGKVMLPDSNTRTLVVSSGLWNTEMVTTSPVRKTYSSLAAWVCDINPNVHSVVARNRASRNFICANKPPLR